MLNAVVLDLGGGVNLFGSTGVITLGAVNQFAEANPDGSSRAASGAVSDQGAIGVGNASGFPSDASIDLGLLLDQVPAGSAAFSDLTVTAEELASTANQTAAGIQTGTYQLGSLTVDGTSPLLAAIATDLQTAVDGTIEPAIAGIEGLLRTALCPPIGPCAVVVDTPDLDAIIAGLGTVSTPSGSIVVDLQTGSISIDVEQILIDLGLDISNLPPNTELLPYITDALTNDLLPALTTAVNDAILDITTAISSISATVLGIAVAPAVLGPILTAVVSGATGVLDPIVTDLGSTVITPLAEALTFVVSLQANGQTVVAGEFTETALRVRLLPGLDPDLAALNLASSSVGPNLGSLVLTATSIAPTSGPQAGGNTATVTGTGFVPGATTVTVTPPGGGAPVVIPAADVTVNAGGTAATFTVPPSAAPGDATVTLTTPGGTTTPPLAYEYIAPPTGPPTITTISPPSGPVAGGNTVTITGTNFVPGGTSVVVATPGGQTITIPPGEATVSNGGMTLTFVMPGSGTSGEATVSVVTELGTSGTVGYVYVSASNPTTPPPARPPGQLPTTGTAIGTAVLAAGALLLLGLALVALNRRRSPVR